MDKLMLVLGTIILLFGLYLSVTTNLLGALQGGLNGSTENALIFDIIGVVCLIVGWASRS